MFFLIYIASAVLSATVVQDDIEKLFWDRGNSILRRSAHDFLFEHFSKGKVSVYSKDKDLLSELVIYDKSTPIDKEKQIDLAEGTHRVAGIFDLLILRGEKLGRIKGGGFSKQQQGRGMRLLKKSDQELIFQMIKLPLPKKEMPELKLNIFCSDNIVVDIVALASSHGVNSDFDEHQKAQVDVKKNKDGKLPINERFRQSTMNRSYDELASGLSEKSYAFNSIIYPSRMTALDVVAINGVLVDRRVSRLYEELSRLSEAEAEEMSCASFEKEFASFKTNWKDTTLLPERMKYAVEANLFLCAEFSSTKTAMEKIDQWNSWHSSQVADRGFAFKHSAKLDPIYSMNLQAMMIMRKRNFSVDQLNSWLAIKLGPILADGGNPPVVLKQKVLPTSDWTVRQSDILTYVPVIDNSGALVNPKKQVPVFDVFRKELVGAGGGNSE